MSTKPKLVLLRGYREKIRQGSRESYGRFFDDIARIVREEKGPRPVAAGIVMVYEDGTCGTAHGGEAGLAHNSLLMAIEDLRRRVIEDE